MRETKLADSGSTQPAQAYLEIDINRVLHAASIKAVRHPQSPPPRY